MTTRLFAGLELALIVLPTTIAAIFFGSGGLLSASFTLSGVLFVLSMAIAVIGIASLWRLLTPLMLGGFKLVEPVAHVWWRAMYVAGTFVAVGFLAMLIARSLIDPAVVARSALGSITVVAFFGLPMLIPLAHLTIERARHARSKNQ